MKESDVSTYFSTFIEFKLSQSAMTRKCQQIDYCLVVMIKGIANFGNTVCGLVHRRTVPVRTMATSRLFYNAVRIYATRIFAL